MDTLSHLFAQNQSWADSIRQRDPDFFEKLSRQQNPEYLCKHLRLEGRLHEIEHAVGNDYVDALVGNQRLLRDKPARG